MDYFLNWYAQNNKNVILILSTVIGLGLIYFLYRMLFVHQSVQESLPKKILEPSESFKAEVTEERSNASKKSASSSVETPVAEINNLQTAIAIDPQSNESVSGASAQASVSSVEVSTEVSTEASVKAEQKSVLDEVPFKALQDQLDAAQAELKQVKLDNSQFRREAAVAQDELAQVKNQMKNQNDNNNGIQYVDTTQLTGDESMIKRIDELQNKLQEYDIISDDISELQNLRKTNAELSKQLAEKSLNGE